MWGDGLTGDVLSWYISGLRFGRTAPGAFSCVLGSAPNSRPAPRFDFAFWLRFGSVFVHVSVKTRVLELRFEFCGLRSRTVRFGSAC